MKFQWTFSRIVSQDVINVYDPISWDCFLMAETLNTPHAGQK